MKGGKTMLVIGILALVNIVIYLKLTSWSKDVTRYEEKNNKYNYR